MEYDHFSNRNEEIVDSNAVINWKAKAKNLLVSACGEDSQHFKLFEKSERSTYSSNLDNLRRMMAVFEAARENFEGAYLRFLKGKCFVCRSSDYERTPVITGRVFGCWASALLRSGLPQTGCAQLIEYTNGRTYQLILARCLKCPTKAKTSVSLRPIGLGIR
jgi:hypothetical protein